MNIFNKNVIALFGFGAMLLASPLKAQEPSFYASSTKNESAWSAFNEKNGEWNLAMDATKNKPFRAFGKPIQINSFAKISQDNAESAARQFIQDNVNEFSISSTDLSFISAIKVGQLWYIRFYQTYQGVRVVNSTLDLRVREDAKVIAFGLKTFDDIQISVKPAITPNMALAVACKEYQISATESNQIINSNSAKEVYILPVKNNNKYEYKLVYSVDIDKDISKYKVYVDAGNSSIVQKRKLSTDAETSIECTGLTKTRTPQDSLVDNIFPYQIFTLNGVKDTSDWYGKTTVEVSQKSPITANIEGKYFSITRDTASKNAKFSDSITPGVPFKIRWDSTNSHRYERNVYFFANKAYEMLKEIDSNYTAMDFKMKVTLYFDSDGANANSGGSVINFVGLGDKNDRMTDMPDVFFHEYGHSITKLLYDQISKTNNGIINLACNEALADINAVDYTDNPKMGVGYNAASPNAYIRILENTKVYPTDIVSDDHNTALILSGAYWDLRKTTSLDYLKRVSHFAKYGMPDDVDYGIAFSEWFYETLITDDNLYGDADLSNGSPHAKEIIKAFNKHNIGMRLYLSNSFVYKQIKDTLLANEELPINGKITQLSNFGSTLDSLILVYSTDNFVSSKSIKIARSDSGSFANAIPAISEPVVVKYYFKAFYSDSSEPITFYANSLKAPYMYMVKYVNKIYDNFETDNGWTVGISSDKATRAIWERSAVIAATSYMSYYFPSEDKSSNGTFAFITGKSTSTRGDTNYTNGTTSLFSPNYDLTNIPNPVIKFYAWLNGMDWSGSSASFLPKIRMYLSSDNGSTWKLAYQITNMESSWQSMFIPVGDYLSSSNTLKVKFTFDPVYRTYTYAKAYIDDFQIWTPEGLLGVEERYALNSANSVYPNPSSSIFNFTFSQNNEGSGNLIISDILGNQVYVQNNIELISGKNSFQYDALAPNPGAYYYKFISADGIKTGTMIKN